MLYVVARATNQILERFEAWRSDLFEAVKEYCDVHGLTWDGNNTITMMGDMIVFVEEA